MDNNINSNKEAGEFTENNDADKNSKNDSQKNSFQLTINNPLDYGYTHEAIKAILISQFKTLRFYCLADEISESGTPHTHIYVCFKSRVRFSTVKKHFTEAHIEIAHGGVKSNLDYIKKIGKWENTEKAETRVEGSYEEFGKVPTQKGNNADMEELLEMIENGDSNMDILRHNNDYILNIDKLDKLRTIVLTDKFKNERRLSLTTTYVFGATGTGKTRGVLDYHGDSNVYRVVDYLHPFDGYSCQPVIAFDEFRSNITLTNMLLYCDIYPIELPSRYTNKFCCANTIYIVSNLPLEMQYQEKQFSDEVSWNAFLRRINKVKKYNEDGTIEVYNSVQDYFDKILSTESKLSDEQQEVIEELKSEVAQ